MTPETGGRDVGKQRGRQELTQVSVGTGAVQLISLERATFCPDRSGSVG